MLIAEFDADIALQTLDAMTEQIKTLGSEDMPKELTDWQAEDMHRRYPATDAGTIPPDQYNALTSIFPRSRTYAQTHPYQRVLYKGGQRERHPTPRSAPRPVVVSHHPILRSELYDKLVSRMTALLVEKITWR